MRKKTVAALMFATSMLGVHGTAFALYGPGPESTDGCTAPLVSDWDDDATIDDAAGQIPKAVNEHAAPGDMNLTSTNLTWAGDHLVADVGLVNADTTILPPADSQGGNYWYVFFTTADGTVHFVKATNTTLGGLTYAYGHIGRLSADGVDAFDTYTTDGSTTGSLTQGPGGHITIDVPASLGITPGATLTEVFANADGIMGYDDNAGFNNHIDEAPDGVDTFNPGGVTYTVTDCSATA
jgi:hypothetical protein